MSKPAQKMIAQIFTSGTLEEKYALILAFANGGHSLLYSGDVAWKLVIPAQAKTHTGAADSMDAALSQIRHVLEDIMKTLSPATKIALAVDEPPG